MKYSTAALAIAGMATTVQGHGFLLSPKPRMPGDAFEAACGQQVYYNQGTPIDKYSQNEITDRNSR
jgi:hypothetical protein